MERKVAGILYDQEQINKVFHGKKERGMFLRWLDKDELIEESTVDEKSMNRKYNFNLRFKHVDY